MKRLKLSTDLQEDFEYPGHSIPLYVVQENLDDYFESRWSLHWIDDVEISMVLEGSLDVTVYDFASDSNTKMLLEPGDTLYIQPGRLREQVALVPGTKTIQCLFPPTIFSKFYEAGVYQREVAPLLRSDINYYLFDKSDSRDAEIEGHVRDLLEIEDGGACYEIRSMSHVCEIWALLFGRIQEMERAADKVKVNERLEKSIKAALSFIRNNYDRQISVEDIANASMLSRTNCYAYFNDVLGKPPMKYLNDFRLEVAAEKLATTDSSAASIAAQCGFTSPSYFGKVFKERFGRTPFAYRRSFE